LTSGTAEFLREDGLPHHNSFYIGRCVRKGKNTACRLASILMQIGWVASVAEQNSPRPRLNAANHAHRERGARLGSSVGLSAAGSARYGVWTESPDARNQKFWLLIAKS
jgi:hypothetical protein